MWHLNRPPEESPRAGGETAAEELILDPRGALTPSAMVELKLTALLNGHGQVVSKVVVCRQSSRDHGPAQSLADALQTRPRRDAEAPLRRSRCPWCLEGARGGSSSKPTGR
jgi:hypothetical protein